MVSMTVGALQVAPPFPEETTSIAVRASLGQAGSLKVKSKSV
jgi:hypothetical protein